MKLLFVFLAATVLMGCDRFQEFDMRGSFTNASFYHTQLTINGKVVDATADQNLPMEFTVRLAVPVNTDPYAPDETQKMVRMPVGLKVLDKQGAMTKVIDCEFGARAITHIVYKVTGTYPYLYEDFYCYTTR